MSQIHCKKLCYWKYFSWREFNCGMKCAIFRARILGGCFDNFWISRLAINSTKAIGEISNLNSSELETSQPEHHDSKKVPNNWINDKNKCNEFFDAEIVLKMIDINHSDALADINKISKMTKNGHFRPKTSFLTQKNAQKCPKSPKSQKVPTVARKDDQNASIWRIYWGM